MQIARAIWEFVPVDHFAQLASPSLLVLPVPPSMAELDAWQTDKRSQVERITHQWPHVQARWLAESIHDIPWQRPVELAELLIEFWRATVTQSAVVTDAGLLAEAESVATP
jgi:hypothetical protein